MNISLAPALAAAPGTSLAGSSAMILQSACRMRELRTFLPGAAGNYALSRALT